MTEVRVSNPLNRYFLLPLDFGNVGAALEPNRYFLKVKDLVLVRLEQFVSLISLPSFPWVGMQHFPHHFRQFFGIPVLKNIQELPDFELIELVLIRLSIYFSAVSQSTGLQYG